MFFTDPVADGPTVVVPEHPDDRGAIAVGAAVTLVLGVVPAPGASTWRSHAAPVRSLTWDSR